MSVLVSGVKQANWLVTVGVGIRPEFPGMSRAEPSAAGPLRETELACSNRSLPALPSGCNPLTILRKKSARDWIATCSSACLPTPTLRHSLRRSSLFVTQLLIQGLYEALHPRAFGSCTVLQFCLSNPHRRDCAISGSPYRRSRSWSPSSMLSSRRCTNRRQPKTVGLRRYP